MIGELSATACLKNRKARVEQISRIGARASSVDGRMLEKPNKFGGASVGDFRHAPLHERNSLGITDLFLFEPPVDGLNGKGAGVHGPKI